MSITQTQIAHTNHLELFKFQIMLRNSELLFQNSCQNKTALDTAVRL